METITYKGFADQRKFSKADFGRLGVENQGAVTFKQGEETEVSPEAAEALRKRYPSDFSASDAAPKEAASATDEGAGGTEGPASGSLGSQGTDGAATGGTGARGATGSVGGSTRTASK